MTKPAKIIRLVLGDQLNERHSWFQSADSSVLVVMMEIMPETEIVTHHIQKLAAVFGAMRRFSRRLIEIDQRVLYLDINDRRNKHSFLENLVWITETSGASRIETQQPDDYRLNVELAPDRIAAAVSKAAHRTVEAAITGSEHFLITADDAADMMPEDKSPRMEFFYRRVRKRYRWLMDSKGLPLGKKWNLDKDNRAKWRGEGKDPAIPEPYRFFTNVTSELSAIKRGKCKSFGSIDETDFRWPLTRLQALDAVDDFLQRRLQFFGTYQDAMHSRQRTLFHSLLSFALNVKLISPAEVIEAALARWQQTGGTDGPIGLNQIEGFVRQIAGWREYMRVLYRRMMPELANTNALAADIHLPEWYWSGDTRMRCLSIVITQSLEDAYAHHIQRLMVTGAFAMMAGIIPEEVDGWYLGIYIDAFDWVERPNTRGMSQYADGGIIGSKPYAATARYIDKQSDYCDGCFYNQRTRTDEDSCPFNALYWNFYERNQVLRNNRRIGFVYPTLEKMSGDERSSINSRSEWIRDHLKDL